MVEGFGADPSTIRSAANGPPPHRRGDREELVYAPRSVLDCGAAVGAGEPPMYRRIQPNTSSYHWTEFFGFSTQ
jgi:hypothetical protein